MSAPSLGGLRVRTARVVYAGPGRLDITLKSRDQIGIAFAPRWAILEPALESRERAKALWTSAEEDARLVLQAKRHDSAECATLIRACAAERIEEVLSAAWSTYVPAYLGGLERSRGIRMDAWSTLAEWAGEGRQIVGVCFCAGPETAEPKRRCHRFLWAGYLVGMGATCDGEIVEQERPALAAQGRR